MVPGKIRIFEKFLKSLKSKKKSESLSGIFRESEVLKFSKMGFRS